MAGGWSTFDHTGDLGLEVWADSPEDLYGSAAVALSAQIARSPSREGELLCELSLEGDDPEDLLVHWLNVTLLEAETRRAFWTQVRVSALSLTSLRATLEGQRLDRRRHELLREIKAVSHHQLELDLVARPCRCRLILDL